MRTASARVALADPSRLRILTVVQAATAALAVAAGLAAAGLTAAGEAALAGRAVPVLTDGNATSFVAELPVVTDLALRAAVKPVAVGIDARSKTAGKARIAADRNLGRVIRTVFEDAELARVVSVALTADEFTVFDLGVT
jgi:hypothetical protein